MQSGAGYVNGRGGEGSLTVRRCIDDSKRFALGQIFDKVVTDFDM